MTADKRIVHNSRGYWTLTIDGQFAGNYDTYSEAENDCEQKEQCE